jgi:hypothetical protein
MYIDPTGMDFDPASERLAQKTEKAIQEKIHSLKTNESNKDRVTELNKSLDDISQMRNDHSTVYSYKKTDNKVNTPTTTQVGTNRKGQKRVNMYYDSQGTQIHEGRHGGDIARGNLNIDNNSSGYNYGVSHEVGAYRAQYAFDGYIDLKSALSRDDIHNLDMQGLRPNAQFTRYTLGLDNINTDFVRNIVEFYKDSQPQYLYKGNKFGLSDEIWFSR